MDLRYEPIARNLHISLGTAHNNCFESTGKVDPNKKLRRVDDHHAL